MDRPAFVLVMSLVSLLLLQIWALGVLLTLELNGSRLQLTLTPAGVVWLSVVVVMAAFVIFVALCRK